MISRFGGLRALVEQGTFLRRLGVEHRARALAAARPDREDTLTRQLSRLIDAEHMGTLFKAAGLWSKGAPRPPGFEERA